MVCCYDEYRRIFLLIFITIVTLNNNASSFQPIGSKLVVVRSDRTRSLDGQDQNSLSPSSSFLLHRSSRSSSTRSSSTSSSYSSSSSSLSSTLSQSLEFELKPSITSISPQDWNSCLNNDSVNLPTSTTTSTTITTTKDENDEDQDTFLSSSSLPSSPFLEYSWLASLEESKCASSNTGWMPSHIQIKFNGSICAFVPLYIKSNSNGEFIFDGEWAQYAYRMNIKYYPKIVVGIPFTPVTCSKILISPGFRYHLMESRRSTCSISSGGGGEKNDNNNNDAMREFRSIVAKFIQEVATSNNLSSVHLNFITDDEAYDIAGPIPNAKGIFQNKNNDNSSSTKEQQHDKNNNETDNTSSSSSSSASSQHTPIQDRVKSVMNRFVQQHKQKESEYFRRTSLQYHWQNINQNNNNIPYTSFDDYLSCFKSKKRITIKRERKRVFEDQNIIIDAVKGKDILKYPGLVERMFEIYKSTVDKQIFFGKQYLTLEFFQRLVESDFINNLLFMCARYDSGNGNEELDAKDVFAGTFNIVKDKVYYGRYWGCLPEYEVKNLHFEVCYWSAIEYCINNDFIRMEPGAGGGGKCHDKQVKILMKIYVDLLLSRPTRIAHKFCFFDVFFFFFLLRKRLQVGKRFQSSIDKFCTLCNSPYFSTCSERIC